MYCFQKAFLETLQSNKWLLIFQWVYNVYSMAEYINSVSRQQVFPKAPEITIGGAETTRQYNIKDCFPIRRGAVNAKCLNSEDMETAIFVFLPIRKTLEYKRSSNTFYIEYICLFGEVWSPQHSVLMPSVHLSSNPILLLLPLGNPTVDLMEGKAALSSDSLSRHCITRPLRIGTKNTSRPLRQH